MKTLALRLIQKPMSLHVFLSGTTLLLILNALETSYFGYNHYSSSIAEGIADISISLLQMGLMMIFVISNRPFLRKKLEGIGLSILMIWFYLGLIVPLCN